MHSAAVATFTREQPLRAMWQAFCVRSFEDQQLVEIDAGVVLVLLNARYYDPSRGQFLSQDPVFWELGISEDGSRALFDPQALNSYAYANGNPIVGKDPTGRFWWKGFYDWSGYSGPKGLLMKDAELLRRSGVVSAIQQNANTINSAAQANHISPELIKAIYYEESTHLLPFESTYEQLSTRPYSYGEMQVGKDKASVDCLRTVSCHIVTGSQYLGQIKQSLVDENIEPTNAQIASVYNGLKGQPLGTVTNYGTRIQSSIANQQYNSAYAQLVSGLSSLVASLKSYVADLQASKSEQ